MDYVSPRLTFYASTIRTREHVEAARLDREYWAEQDSIARIARWAREDECRAKDAADV